MSCYWTLVLAAEDRYVSIAALPGIILNFLQPRPGVDGGPISLVQAGLPKQLEELGWQVTFDGHHQFEEISTQDDPPIGILKNPRQVSKVCEAVAQTVGAHAKNGQLPLTLGGDHSLVSTVCQSRRGCMC